MKLYPIHSLCTYVPWSMVITRIPYLFWSKCYTIKICIDMLCMYVQALSQVNDSVSNDTNINLTYTSWSTSTLRDNLWVSFNQHTDLLQIVSIVPVCMMSICVQEYFQKINYAGAIKIFKICIEGIGLQLTVECSC